MAGTADSGRLMSGGADGTVRVWRIGRDSQVLEHSMKEHKVNDVQRFFRAWAVGYEQVRVAGGNSTEARWVRGKGEARLV